MNTEKTYIHRRVCLCRQCGGTGSVTVYAEKDVRREYPQQKVCPQCQGSGRIWLSGTVIKQIEPYAEPEPYSVQASQGGSQSPLQRNQSVHVCMDQAQPPMRLEGAAFEAEPGIPGHLLRCGKQRYNRHDV